MVALMVRRFRPRGGRRGSVGMRRRRAPAAPAVLREFFFAIVSLVGEIFRHFCPKRTS